MSRYQDIREYLVQCTVAIYFYLYYNEEYQFRSKCFCYWHFLATWIFKLIYLLKLCPIFGTSLLIQFSKFNNFLWICCFLGKIFQILYPLLESSTTRIAISMYIHCSTTYTETVFCSMSGVFVCQCLEFFWHLSKMENYFNI